MSSKISLMPKKRKSYWNVSEIGPSPLKVDADDADADDDADDDDGRVGIWKAPLPDGTAEQKIHTLHDDLAYHIIGANTALMKT